MPEPGLLFAALLLGLAGNVHCLGMCGGIVAALGFRDGPPTPTLLIGYNLGRLLSYAMAGLLVGSLAGWIGQLPLLGPALRITAGLLIVAMGLYLAGWLNLLAPLERLGGRLWQRLPHPVLGERRHLLPAIATGMAWGWLPCGLVYSTLAWAAAQGQGPGSAALMFAFGIGTLPSMLATGLAAGHLRRLLQHRHFRRLTGLSVILFGLWTLILPLSHSSHAHQHNAPAGSHERHQHGTGMH